MINETGFFVDENDELRKGRIAVTAIVAVLALVLLFGSFRVIGAEEVGIPVTLGKVGDKASYGLTMKWPLITHFVRFDKTVQKMALEDATYTKDIQPSTFEYVFTYRIVSDNAPLLYLEAGTDYEAKLIEPKLHAALKDVIGHYTATELVANREKAACEVEDKLRTELSPRFFANISVSFNNIDYSDAFEKGIEAKVLAEQDAQKAKNRTAQIEEEGRQSVIKAKAEADAAKTVAEGKAKAMDIEGAAIRRNVMYLELKKLDVQAQLATSAGNWKTVIMSSDQAQTLLNLPTAE